MTNLKILLAAVLLLTNLFAYSGVWDTDYAAVERQIEAPKFPDKTYPITKYGARTTAKASDNQKAINKAIAECSRKGGGRVVVSAGVYRTGALRLQSNVNLVVEAGATLQFVFEPELYPIVETRWEGLDCHNLSPCIYAVDAENVAITGKGTIDGGGTNETWWKWCGAPRYGWTEGTISQRNGSRARLLKMAEDGVDKDERVFGAEDGLRPQLINFNRCNGVLIEDVTLLRSPFWVIHPLLSSNITVRGVNIVNDGPNGDGCDPESCNGVLIENCFFNTGDDCIAIKSGRNNDGRLWDTPSQNIIVRNCHMQNGHGGVVIGSEISGGCRNVYVENNVMDSPNLDRVIRIKTNTCRGGVIENINVRNVKVGQCRESVLKINLDYEHNEICCRGYLPTVRNVTLDNVRCEKSKYGVQIIALDTCVNVSDITIRDCRFNNVADGNSITGRTKDINFINYYVNGSLCLGKSPYRRYSEWMTASEMKRQPRSYMLDFSTRPKWSYVMGIELEAMLDTYLKYGNEKIRRYCQEYTDTMINADGTIRNYKLADYNLDNIRTGHFVARMQSLWPEEKNRKAMMSLLEQIKKQPRTKEGVFWHKAIYAYQVWLDGIFMGLPYAALATSDLYGPESAEAKAVFNDAIDQVFKTYERTLDKTTGLNRHAWDENRDMFWSDSITGLSQHCWGRAQGWYTMALVELLDAMPETFTRKNEVVSLLEKTLSNIVKWQDKDTGLWFQVMDSPEREGNYPESTCSSMFAYALLKAYRKGYVGADYRDAGIKAYRRIINRFIRVESDSTISLTDCCSVAGLGPGLSPAVKAVAPNVKENRRRDGSYDYYLSEKIRDNDAKGLGPFIWASLEMEQLGFDVDNTMKPIDRRAVVGRNNPIVTRPDTLSSLSVGNGHFAVTVDVTGLQSYPEEYKNGIPLCTMSDWGWHSFINADSLKESDSRRIMNLHNRPSEYAVEYKQPGRNMDATSYFRVNPHRLNLATIGLSLTDNEGNKLEPDSLKSIKQELALWDGMIYSSFTADGTPVETATGCDGNKDRLFSRIKSKMLGDGRAKVTFRFPYPTGNHSDDASDWTKPELHTSKIIAADSHYAIVKRTLDSCEYYMYVQWEGSATFTNTNVHSFTLSAEPGNDLLTFSAEFTPEMPIKESPAFSYDQALKAVMKTWEKFWQSGAFVDFGECTDPRAPELERRTILSQYLTKINCDNALPPQETGLTYNSWYGRPHLEMVWWHMVDFALWNRPETMSRILQWYNDKAFGKACDIASRQGFDGARWMKMTSPDAEEAPSNTGSFLTWQQPHYIYMAEEMWRRSPTDSTLAKYSKQVEATARFMADFALACATDDNGPIKLHGATAMQESMSKDFSMAHPFEQAYWHYGLATAQKWRERNGQERNPQWDMILSRLAPLSQNDRGLYAAGEPVQDFSSTSASSVVFNPYSTPPTVGNSKIGKTAFEDKSRSDHPAVLGACGLLPATNLYDSEVMTNTLIDILNDWNWGTTWGWDYGMIAMAAARLNQPEKALEALLTEKGKNTYLPNGHNFQEPKRLRLYLPGNGALLSAIAMMCAGWDGCPTVNNPGFPADGKWNVRWEGLQRMQ